MAAESNDVIDRLVESDPNLAQFLDNDFQAVVFYEILIIPNSANKIGIKSKITIFYYFEISKTSG